MTHNNTAYIYIYIYIYRVSLHLTLTVAENYLLTPYSIQSIIRGLCMYILGWTFSREDLPQRKGAGPRRGRGDGDRQGSMCEDWRSWRLPYKRKKGQERFSSRMITNIYLSFFFNLIYIYMIYCKIYPRTVILRSSQAPGNSANPPLPPFPPPPPLPVASGVARYERQ